MDVAPDVRAEIDRRLARVEDEEGVSVLYACESGSRAWGFPSTDSDYDVRFIYVRPRDWYLSIDVERKRDVIERPITDEIDLNGWDLRKALQLLRKSNPPLLEWLRSPIVYRTEPPVVEALKEMAVTYYSPVALSYHYWHMARGNFKGGLQGERIRLKKYFYALRPLLAVKWIEEDRGPVPVEFGALVDHIITDPALKRAIYALLDAKRAGEELDDRPRIPPIHQFIEAEVERLEQEAFGRKAEQPPIEPLNDFFRRIVRG